MKPILITALCICNAITGFGQSIFNLVPGTDNKAWQWPVEFLNEIAFILQDTIGNYELWKYDGSNPVSNVYELNPSGAGVYGKCIVMNNTLYFNGNNGNGWQLYKWDGTSNPALVKDFNSGSSNGGYPNNFVVLNNKLYFSAADTGLAEVWEHNPNNNITKKLTNLGPGGKSTVQNLTGFKNKLYFTGQELAPYDSIRLRVCDPATSVVTLVQHKPSGYHPTYFHAYGSKLYFLDFDGSSFELFSYDGSTTQQLTNIGTDNKSGILFKDPSNSYLVAQQRIIYYKDRIYFFGRVKQDDNYAFMAYDINSQSASIVHSFGVKDENADLLAVYHDKLYFRTKSIHYNNGNISYLFSYDGSNAPVIVDTALSLPSHPIVYKDDLYIVGTLNTGGNQTLGVYHFNTPDITNSIKTTPAIHNATLYPNPASNNTTLEFNLNTTQQLSVTVADMTGRTVYTTSVKQYNAGNNKANINITNFAIGIYSCRLITGNNETVWTGKLLKE